MTDLEWVVTSGVSPWLYPGDVSEYRRPQGPIPVIDLFAGPGGLNEGFSSVSGDDSGTPIFETKASFEMDALACETLRVRATYRRLKRNGNLEPYYEFVRSGDLGTFIDRQEVREHWQAAEAEVFQHELGPDNRDVSDAVIGGLVSPKGPWVLIGGPPCQAYSLAGRSRRAHDETWATDHKHVLYREYLHIIQKFQPVAFVMENVKGMLSSKYDGGRIFTAIMDDLQNAGPGYEIRSLVTGVEPPPGATKDFVVRSEAYGVPQTRHRVLLFGVRRDAAHLPSKPLDPYPGDQVTVRDTIGELPWIRSRVTPVREDSFDAWQVERRRARRFVKEPQVVTETQLAPGRRFLPGRSHVTKSGLPGKLRDWIVDGQMPGLLDHVEKAHRCDDLWRYYFYAHGAKGGAAVSLKHLPEELLPDHKNVRQVADGAFPFNDRFRVQRWEHPSGTVVSHIGKDGHYFIHPEPEQMRSLTVREAARLQTFPDNYWFAGTPSRQYHQVGNAVPPYLAKQIGEVVAGFVAGIGA